MHKDVVTKRFFKVATLTIILKMFALKISMGSIEQNDVQFGRASLSSMGDTDPFLKESAPLQLLHYTFASEYLRGLRKLFISFLCFVLNLVLWLFFFSKVIFLIIFG